MSFTIKVFSEHMKILEQEVINALEQRGDGRRIHSLTFLSEEDLTYLAEWYKKKKATPTTSTTPTTNINQTTNNQEPTNSDKEQSAMRFMENHIKNADVIFIDACSLMHDSGVEFLNNVSPVLKKYNKRLIVPKKVYDELEDKSKQTTNKKLAQNALAAMHVVIQGQANQLIDIFGDENLDTFADGVFLTQIQRLRITRNVLLITNDIVLGKEVLSMNASKAVRGKEVKVVKVSNFAYLQRVHLDNENPNTSGPVKSTKKIKRKVAPNSFSLAKQVVQYNNESLTYSTTINENTVVYDQNKQAIRLGKELGKGGEGSVYATTMNGVVAKIYKKDRITREKYEKLKLMISKPLSYPGICYPQKLLFDSRGDFVGYTMPQAQGKELKRKFFVPKKEIDKNLPNLKRSDLVAITIDILDKIEYLHQHNIILGDINPFNILVDDHNKVYFVDVDSYQVEGFPCPVGTLIYTAPEIQGKHYPTFLRTFGNEYFAIATLVFTIQFLGKSPYDQTGSESGAQNIQKMDFPYTFRREERADNTPKGQWRLIWSNLSYPMRKAFYETFQKDEANATEQTRMSVTDWKSILERYYNDLTTGKFVKEDSIANEIFPNRYRATGDAKAHLKNCKICNQSFQERSLNHGICHKCLNVGEEYTCAGPNCSKELVHTNFEKYVRGITTRFKYCKECNTMMRRTYKTITCVSCNDTFKFTYDDKYYYESKGYHLPTKCKPCRRNNSNNNNSRPQTTTTSSSTSTQTSKPRVDTTQTTTKPEKKSSIISILKQFLS